MLIRRGKYAPRKVVLAFAIVLAIGATYLVSTAKRHIPTDCEIAKFFYNPKEASSFESFLEKQFRVHGVIDPGGLFVDPHYSFFIYHPYKESNRYKGYEYLISRSGTPHSRKAISISKDSWDAGTRIRCEEGFKNQGAKQRVADIRAVLSHSPSDTHKD